MNWDYVWPVLAPLAIALTAWLRANTAHKKIDKAINTLTQKGKSNGNSSTVHAGDV
jgi:hypothetical protein